MFGSFLPSLWSSINHSLLGSRSRHCYAIMFDTHFSGYRVNRNFGQEFPKPAVDSVVDFAILRIFDEEPYKEYRVGFHRFDADITQIEEAVRSCTIHD